MKKYLVLVLFFVSIGAWGIPGQARDDNVQRNDGVQQGDKTVGSYFYMGDGVLKFTSAGAVKFRDKNGNYIDAGLKGINQLYGTPWNNYTERMGIRLIELLDYIEDSLGGNGIQIISGYRSPDHNENLRANGKIAASSSLHIDSEAIDMVMSGAPSPKIFEFIKEKDCCGVGYYHGKAVHVDTGPSRYWDEKTSGTEKKEPPENENIMIETEKDIYKGADAIKLKFSRVNIYPFGMKEKVRLTCDNGGDKATKVVAPLFWETVENAKNGCVKINDRESSKLISLRPTHGVAGKCSVEVDFCEPVTKKMPASIRTKTFEIK